MDKTIDLIVDKAGTTSRLLKDFDKWTNNSKYPVLKRVKKNKDFIDKRIEKLGGLNKILERMEQNGWRSHKQWFTEVLDDINVFLDVKRDLIEQEEERRKARRKPKPVVAIELDSKTKPPLETLWASLRVGGKAGADKTRFKEYKSINEAHENLGINPGQIKMCCEGKNNVKTGLSKKNGKRYTFYYAFH